MTKDVLCHLCDGKMWRKKDFYICSRCSHVAKAILPPSEADQLFKDEIEYKESVIKHGSGGSTNARSPRTRPRRGVPWYDIDRISAEGSPGQGFKS